MFRKGSTSLTLLKGTLVTAAGLAVIASFSSWEQTAVATRTVVGGTSAGVGVLGGSVEEIAPGFKFGWDAAEGADGEGFMPSQDTPSRN